MTGTWKQEGAGSGYQYAISKKWIIDCESALKEATNINKYNDLYVWKDHIT